MSAKKIIGCCIAGAAVCGVAVAAFKIVRDILEEKNMSVSENAIAKTMTNGMRT